MATTFELLCEKLLTVEDFLNENDLHINFNKSLYMCIGRFDDKIRESIKSQHGTVNYKSETIYLGTSINECGKITVLIDNDMKYKGGNVKCKLANFVNNNENAPLKIKINIMDACFYSVIRYNCETWGRLAGKKVNALYNYVSKCVLV